MTWGLDPDTGEVWRDDPSTTEVVTTIETSVSYSSTDVLDVMGTEWQSASGDGADYILIDMIREDIDFSPAP